MAEWSNAHDSKSCYVGIRTGVQIPLSAPYMPLWWNWQTRWTQNPVVAIPCRFDPDQRHQKRAIQTRIAFFVPYARGRIPRNILRSKTSGTKRDNSNPLCFFMPYARGRIPRIILRSKTSGTKRDNSNPLCFFVSTARGLIPLIILRSKTSGTKRDNSNPLCSFLCRMRGV